MSFGDMDPVGGVMLLTAVYVSPLESQSRFSRIPLRIKSTIKDSRKVRVQKNG